ncbi:MAG: MG2 domain-containing protein [Thermoanaerobaculia bacterium]|nr:MG2 domain-containing protein [Thermoanaerobaculia bacterium]
MRSRARVLVYVAVLAAVAVVVFFLQPLLAENRKKPKPGAKPAQEANVNAAPTWTRVDKLIDEQKLEEARKEVEKLRKRARAAGDSGEWTRALVREVQLETALSGFETAVRFLKSEPWPDEPLSRTLLNLFYAHSLETYNNAYSWEIGKRERVDTKGEVDLKAWTRDQIYVEAQKAYLEVWKGRESLSDTPVTKISEFVSPNSYPEGIRGTLRDAVSYLFVELLANSSHWTPEQSNDLFRLDRRALLKGSEPKASAAALTDPGAHPLMKISAVLDDLGAWHARRNEQEAVLEVFLERLRRWRASFSSADDLSLARNELTGLLPRYRKHAWWAMGQAELAEIVRAEARPDNLVRARKLALEGHEAYPSSPGGQRCLSIARSIEAPDYDLASMSSDAPGKRSLLIRHRNFGKVFFRAYRSDLVRFIETTKDYSLFPQAEEVRRLVRSEKPVAEWSVDLPATPDFKSHKTFVVPPLKQTGFFTVVASMKPDFREESNKVTGGHILLTSLVMTTKADGEGGYQINVFSGDSGLPKKGASVHLYRLDWQKGHRKSQTLTTDEAGEASFPLEAGKDGGSHFFLAESGRDLAIDPSFSGFSRPYKPGETTGSLVYTDRSIYRPLQKLLWKVVAYRGDSDKAKFEVLKESSLLVNLVDPNGQRVESATVKTNSFGTAAGEFTIPTGRLLGNWMIQSSLGGMTSIGVEEYKRPTFEVEWKEIKDPLRMNRKATLAGEAKYYFGLPVTNGTVKWTVSREPVYPWWWWYWGGGSRAQKQVIASGTTAPDEKGSFSITFLPEAEEPKSASGRELTYRYSVSADVTDEGGETRSATKSLRIGFVSVEADLEVPSGFQSDREALKATIVRRSLDGTPRAGKGSWRLVKLTQPAAQVPSEIPVAKPPVSTGEEGDGAFATEGDRQRARWETTPSAEMLLRQWPDGAEVARGDASHDEKGRSVLETGKLASGAYRLRYETVDEFGTKYETSKEFIVAGEKAELAVPLVLKPEAASVPAGSTARILVHSGLPEQLLILDISRPGRPVERRFLRSSKGPAVLELPVTDADRGGFAVTVFGLRDFQFFQASQPVFVPWDNKQLKVEFVSFRDKLRPGQKEKWTVKVSRPDGKPVDREAAELLAYMYDRSLDIFRPHTPPSVTSVYPYRASPGWVRASLSQTSIFWIQGHMDSPPGYPSFSTDRLIFFDRYGIGGPGRRGYGSGVMFKSAARGGVGAVEGAAEAVPMAMAPPPAPAAAPVPERQRTPEQDARKDANLADETAGKKEDSAASGAESAPVPLRSNFAETAFWFPNLVAGADGSASFEFTVPDSVTSWNVWVHTVTRDMTGGSLKAETKSVKELMVRPYIPRFLREGDQAELKIVVNNASEKELSGTLDLSIFDPETNEDLRSLFGLSGPSSRPFKVPAGGGANLSFSLKTPRRLGTIAVKAVAKAGDLGDGELRPLPVLPSRYHLVQSRFVTLRNKDRKVLEFADLAKNDDPTRVTSQMVVTVDAQLFYTVLQSLPYLIDYPYECTEQTLNRFLSTGIVSTLFDKYPAVAKMAKEMSSRDTLLEKFDEPDPNRRMSLEESPWLLEARGGPDGRDTSLTKVLDPAIARATKTVSLDKLKKAQTASGGFPWFPGGPPSPYMTLYIMHGFGKASEFGVDVPKDVIQRGWQYLARHYRDDLRNCMKQDGCWEFLTFLNYVASSYPDSSYTGNALTPEERKEILDFSFKHWKQHSPYLKGYLALTLNRMGRMKDARLVWDSVMDSARTNEEQGTFWAREDRSWLWYNDTIESHAFALRTLMELDPKDARRDGLVQWLLLNKKLNQWKSTRATAEVIYSLLHYLKAEGALAIREDATVTIGSQKVSFVFEPDRYTGKKNQIVVPGEKVDPKTSSSIIVEKESKGFVFASATWHFSTDELPKEDRGDFFAVSRRYFLRENNGKEWVLKPLADGAEIKVGDQVEVQISLRTKHAAEYVHLRDPRGAGFEPEGNVSRFKWDLGIGWYEEIRDSGTNFFFEQLPVGEYTFKYRIRAAMAGSFRVGPATIQSLYAPEFNAYSAGHLLKISPAEGVRESGQ